MAKVMLQIGATDFTSFLSSYKLDYNVLVKDTGRNASGTLFVVPIATKVKLNCVLRPMTDAEMDTFLDAINPFVLTITYWNPRTSATATGTFYVGTAMPDFYTNRGDNGLFKELALNFIEL